MTKKGTLEERTEWKEGDVVVQVLQCSDCEHRNNSDGCDVFGNIPEGIWNFKVYCDEYDQEI